MYMLIYLILEYLLDQLIIWLVDNCFVFLIIS
jgi:hypothetical protein